MSTDGLVIVIGLGIVTVSCLLATAGLLLVRRLVAPEILNTSHDVGGHLLSVVGTVYAVVLGLVVVDATEKHHQALVITEQEANCLADIYLLAKQFPEKDRDKIHKLCNEYANLLINNEWKLMECQEQCPLTQSTSLELVEAVTGFTPTGEKEVTLHAKAVDEACEMWDMRRARLNLATHGMPLVEWFTLIVGGVLTVAFTYFFALQSLRTQMLMTATVAIVASLNLYLVYVFSAPFSGLMKVTPDAIQLDQDIFTTH